MEDSSSWLDWLAKGGGYAYFVIGLAVVSFLLGIAAAMVAWFKGRVGGILASAALVSCVSIPAAGLIGRDVGMSAANRAAAAAPADIAEEVLAIGSEEASIPLQLSLYLVLVAVAPALVAFGVARGRPAPRPEGRGNDRP